jgi:hypothetical protein
MTKKAQTGQRIRSPLAVLALGLALVGGCTSTPTASTQQHDPLHGVLTPPSIPQPNSAPKTPGQPTSLPAHNNQSFAPIGSPLASTNNATLAGMSGSSLGRPLALDDQGRPLPGNPAPVVPAYNPNPKVERVPDVLPTPGQLAPSSWQAPAVAKEAQPVKVNASPALNEQLTRRLQERGLVDQKIEQVPQGIHLTCYFSRGLEGGLRMLEVTAVDYATAAAAILRQLDR